ncbi:MAG: class I SAM-dependent rRNA methyltransferase [Anaerolineales bacterium]|nr:class I SAM-dependent rRNA methyltransferase [Anaerolineales bacterium]
MNPSVILKPGREKSALNKHPWIYSGAIRTIKGNAVEGNVVAVHGAEGQFLAWGYLNRQSKITVRLFSWDQDERIDREFWRARLAQSISRRSEFTARNAETNAYRLVYAESDGLPGLIVDMYGKWLVVQILTLGMESLKQEIVALLTELVPQAAGIYERSDVDVREKEGLLPSAGPLTGETPPESVIIRENGLDLAVNLQTGHKTGFYLDQRENRHLLAGYSAGAEFLNCFSYTGAFSVYAARGGAQCVTNLDTSTDALALARQNLSLNGFGELEQTFIEVDVFRQLRSYRDAGRQFDLIVLDPPKFAHSQRSIDRAARGYKDINWLAMRLIKPGGFLFTFSCSGVVSADLYQKILFGASLDSGRDVQIVGRMSQGADHPVLITFPESEYLKGFICRVE